MNRTALRAALDAAVLLTACAATALPTAAGTTSSDRTLGSSTAGVRADDRKVAPDGPLWWVEETSSGWSLRSALRDLTAPVLDRFTGPGSGTVGEPLAPGCVPLAAWRP